MNNSNNNFFSLGQTLSKKPFKNGLILEEISNNIFVALGTEEIDKDLKIEFFKNKFLYEKIFQFLEDKEHLLDISSNKGIFSAFASQYFKDKYVITSSYLDKAFLNLNKNLNNLENFHILPFEGLENYNYEESFENETNIDWDNILDTFKNSKIDSFSLLNIDLEGEINNIQSIPEMFLTNTKVVLIKIYENIKNSISLETILTKLDQLGFEIGIFSEMVFDNGIYKSNLIALNTSNFDRESMQSFWEVNQENIKLTIGNKYYSQKRNLFLSYCLVDKEINLSNNLFKKSIGSGYRNDISKVIFSKKIKRLEVLASEIEILFFWCSDWKDSQFKIWEPYIKRLPFNSAVLVQKRKNKSIPESSIPIFFEEDGYEASFFNNLNSLKAVFHPRNGLRDAIFLNNRKLINIFIGHGDSEKIASTAPMHNAYGKIFSAGKRAIQRYIESPYNFQMKNFEIISAPCSPKIKVGKCSKSIKTILYAPTWEGLDSASNYSSVEYAIEVFENIINADASIRFLFLSHPGLGSLNTKYKILRKRLSEMSKRTFKGKLNKFMMFEEADLLFSDISGVTTEFMFTEKPIAILLHPKNSRIREKQKGSCFNYIYKAETDPKEINNLLKLIEKKDPLLRNRLRAKAEKYANCKTFEETSDLFNKVTAKCINEFKNKIETKSKPKKLKDFIKKIIKKFFITKVFFDLIYGKKIGKNKQNIANNKAISIMHKAKNIQMSSILTNEECSEKDHILLYSPYGIVDKKYFLEKKILIQDISSSWVNPPFKKGDILDIVSCNFLPEISKYKIQLSVKNKVNDTNNFFPNNSFTFLII